MSKYKVGDVVYWVGNGFIERGIVTSIIHPETYNIEDSSGWPEQLKSKELCANRKEAHELMDKMCDEVGL